MTKPVSTLIVVADGARARFLENNGVGKGVAALALPDMDGDRTASGDIDADRPGRSRGPEGGRRHGMQPPTDAHDRLEAEFLRGVAARVEEDLAAGRHGRAIVIAAPRALGAIRKLYGAKTKASLVGEVDKDLVDADAETVAANVADLLAV